MPLRLALIVPNISSDFSETFLGYLLAVLTTKAVMSGVLFLLVHFPEMQEKIRQEIKTVIGDREPSIEDMTSLPYTQACLMEILRYQSHLPLTAAHANLSQEVELEGYTIPKETVVCLVPICKYIREITVYSPMACLTNSHRSHKSCRK
jgi:hypothetical protein